MWESPKKQTRRPRKQRADASALRGGASRHRDGSHRATYGTPAERCPNAQATWSGSLAALGRCAMAGERMTRVVIA